MTVELRPFGVLCNIQCRYCYQNPQRDADNVGKSYDIELMKSAVEREGGPFTLFGGEPLLLPERELEELWSWGLKRFGSNSVQTNGTTIRDSHIRLFKQYRVHVGVSIDGPGELNDLRWAGSLEATRRATAKTERVIELLCREGIIPSLIVTLHRINAASANLRAMDEWFRYLDGIGIRFVRLHILESDSPTIRQNYALSVAENTEAFLHFNHLESSLRSLRFDVFADMEKLLLGNDEGVTCIWGGCDPYTTAAVRGVEGHGQRSNCGRTNKDGINFVKEESAGFERYLALYHTDQQYGGCSGCRFFLMCKGQCPGTAVNGDWRNRSEHCEVWKGLFEFLEEKMLASGKDPVSLRHERKQLEERMIESWAQGTNPKLEALLQTQGRGTALETNSAGTRKPQ